jgi:hypothetical protein
LTSIKTKNTYQISINLSQLSENKWALVSWEKLCRPKINCGLELGDPGMLNEVMAQKYGGGG